MLQTAHWVNANFQPTLPNKNKLFGISPQTNLLLYVGRVSKEKGVLELTNIYETVKQKHINTKLVIVGKGPALKQLMSENPDAVFMDWVEREKLPEIYSSADMLVLPSRFDTFCNVVLEALSCGLPVIAYNTKGPKDIIRNGKEGFLVNNQQEMQEKIISFLENKDKEKYKSSAIKRAADYNSDNIIDSLMKIVGLYDDE